MILVVNNMVFKKYFFLLFLGLMPLLQGCLMLRVKEQATAAQKTGGYDVIIVPGVPYEDESMSSLMKMRVLWAAWLFKNGIARNVIFSGGAVYTPYVEARVMGAMAKKAGIPEDHIFYEEEAEHSTENMVFGYRLARTLGFEKIAIASDPVQTWLLSEVSEQFKLYDLGFLPMVPEKIRAQLNTANLSVDIVPINPATFVPLPERKSARERWRGTLGKEIPRDRVIGQSGKNFQQ